jgi:hypothetical protein
MDQQTRRLTETSPGPTHSTENLRIMQDELELCVSGHGRERDVAPCPEVVHQQCEGGVIVLWFADGFDRSIAHVIELLEWDLVGQCASTLQTRS